VSYSLVVGNRLIANTALATVVMKADMDLDVRDFSARALSTCGGKF
jgi:hypothetical protein